MICKKSGKTHFRVIVISRFLQRPQNRSCRNPLIHSQLIKIKSIGREVKINKRGRQSDGYGAWDSEGGWGRGWIRI